AKKLSTTSAMMRKPVNAVAPTCIAWADVSEKLDFIPAKVQVIQPIDYLMRLFEQWPLITEDDDIDHLLPWNIELEH
ncbi:hypothetical protein, partial [Aliidiomarina quisquiliarum]|uniref:hypothetical protein n=1 Tax=Aliidiomarina quisquiliarum TaxID=2938947 RepID=UPI003B8478E2